jgi:hypothetical protein
MRKKVEKVYSFHFILTLQYFQEFSTRCQTTQIEDKEQVQQLFDDLITFMCCITQVDREPQSHRRKNQKRYFEEEHYISARRYAGEHLLYFDRKNMAERLLAKCQDNQTVFGSVISMMTKGTLTSTWN